MENLFLERFEELLNERFNGNKASLAKATGISAPTLSQYFPPRNSSPSAKQLLLLAQAFDCSVDYLLGREDEFGSVVNKCPLDLNYEDEQKLLSAFRTLDAYEKEAILIQVNALAKEKTQIKR